MPRERVAPLLFLMFREGLVDTPSSRHDLSNVKELSLHGGTGDDTHRHAWASGEAELRVQIKDRWISTEHARIEGAKGCFILEDLHSKNGTYVNGQRIERAELRDGDHIRFGQTSAIFRTSLTVDVEESPDLILESVQPLPAFSSLVSSFRRELRLIAEHLAATDTSIALLGETGTGKELLARGIHQLSGRAGRFVAVNCSAIPQELIESELFGYKRGAFSGAARDKCGLVEAAEQGTLFLDEFADFPLELQPKVLRVLQERVVRPVGSTSGSEVDFRTVVATNADIDRARATGRLREDLWARVNEYVHRPAPLRDRIEDIGLLSRALLSGASPEAPLRLMPDAVASILSYSWPHNIRELDAALRLALQLARSEGSADDAAFRAHARHLPRVSSTAPRAASPTVTAPRRVVSPPDEAPRQLSQNQVEAALQLEDGNVTRATARLGLEHREQLYRLVRKFNIDLSRYR